MIQNSFKSMMLAVALTLSAGVTSRAAEDSVPAVHAGTALIGLPPGWKAQETPDGAMITPQSQPKGGCVVVLTKVVDDDVHDDMRMAIIAVDNMLPAQLRPFGRGGISRYDGIAGKGWHYLDLYGSVGDPRENLSAHVLIADLGPKRAAMIGVGSASIETNVYALAPEPKATCLAGQNNRMWVTLFHTLRFPGYEADSPELGRLITGDWSRSGKYSFALTFSGNGDYSYGAAHGLYLPAQQPGMVEEHLTTVANSGHFDIQGDRLIRHCRQGCGGTQEALISIVRKTDPKSLGGFAWTLRTLDLPVPRGDFTYDYGKDR